MLDLIPRNFQNLDSGQSIFFARELEHILSKQFEVEYVDLKARLFLPVSNEVPVGAESYTYYQFDKVGMAKLISDYADDLPRADVSGQKFMAPVEDMAIAAGWSIKEVRNAALVGRSLSTRKLDAARRAHEELVDDIAALGDAKTGLGGFLNNSNVGITTATNGDWLNVATTADEILADLNQIVREQRNASNGKEVGDTLLLPTDYYTHITQMPRTTGTDTTVAEFFLKSNPWLRGIDEWYRLGTAGAGSTPRAVLYRRDPGKLELQIPQEFEMLPVQERNLEFVTPTLSSVGGVSIYKPLSVRYADGIGP
jgi:hypothetical protein